MFLYCSVLSTSETFLTDLWQFGLQARCVIRFPVKIYCNVGNAAGCIVLQFCTHKQMVSLYFHGIISATVHIQHYFVDDMSLLPVLTAFSIYGSTPITNHFKIPKAFDKARFCYNAVEEGELLRSLCHPQILPLRRFKEATFSLDNIISDMLHTFKTEYDYQEVSCLDSRRSVIEPMQCSGATPYCFHLY